MSKELSTSAQFVRSAREKLHLDRPSLASLLGVNKRTLDGWETKRRAPPLALHFLSHLSGLPLPK